MKVRVAVLCFALVAGSSSAGAKSRPPSYHGAGQTIVVTGSETAYAEITIPDPVSITCCHFRSDKHGGFITTGFRATTKGTYVGYALERLSDREIVVGGVLIPRMHQGPFPSIGPIIPGGRIAPGRYRVHLLTDGPSTVRIETSNLEHTIVAHASQPNSSTVLSGFIGGSSNAPVGHGRYSLRLSEHSIIVLASMVRLGDPNKVVHLQACITEYEETRALCDPHGFASYTEYGDLEGTSFFRMVNYSGGERQPGDYTAEIHYSTGGVVKKALALAVAINL